MDFGLTNAHLIEAELFSEILIIIITLIKHLYSALGSAGCTAVNVYITSQECLLAVY